MGTKTIRLDEDVYERIRERKREDETFSEAVDRLVGGRSLLEIAGILSDEGTEDLEESIAEFRSSLDDDVDATAEELP